MDTEPPSFILVILLQPSIIWQFAIIFLLLIASGLISASEVAFFSLTKKELDENKENFPKKIESINNLLKNKKSLLSTILILNNFINIAVVVLVTMATANFNFYAVTLFSGFTIPKEVVKLIFDLGFITFLILLFGEIIPKIYAQKNAMSFSLRMITVLPFFKKILAPISVPLIGLTQLIERNIKAETFSVDQLSQALEITSEDEATTKEEQKILEGIVTFGNTLAKEIITPRVDMFSMEKSTDYAKVIELVKENGYSRIPVYENNEDTIIGILYAKDLIQHIDTKNFNWLNVIKKPIFVPENKKLDDLLSDFQELKTHIAIVVDEYGGTSGLISLEDIIEEIVGEISDEFDDDDITYSRLDEHTYLFEGKTSIKDFLRIIEAENEDLIEEHKGEAETIAGFLLEQLDDFPSKNQIIKFHNFTFVIEAINRKRIKRIKVTIKEIKEHEINTSDD